MENDIYLLPAIFGLGVCGRKFAFHSLQYSNLQKVKSPKKIISEKTVLEDAHFKLILFTYCYWQIIGKVGGDDWPINGDTVEPLYKALKLTKCC